LHVVKQAPQDQGQLNDVVIDETLIVEALDALRRRDIRSFQPWGPSLSGPAH